MKELQVLLRLYYRDGLSRFRIERRTVLTANRFGGNPKWRKARHRNTSANQLRSESRRLAQLTKMLEKRTSTA